LIFVFQPDWLRVRNSKHTLKGVKDLEIKVQIINPRRIKVNTTRNIFQIVVLGGLALVLAFVAIGTARWAFSPDEQEPEVVYVQVPVNDNQEQNSSVVIDNPVSAPNSDCEKQAEQLGAPKDIVSAICDAVPTGKGVSMRLPVGTKVAIGTITFDAENRVWFLKDFTVPTMANYAFEYAGSERSIFDAPFVQGSELGWAKDGSRVPFKICFTTEGDCTPPTNLFPKN